MRTTRQPDDARARIVFDLFGTLVPQFPRVEHDEMLDACSRIVGLEPEVCRLAWRELYVARISGDIAGIAGHLTHVAEGCGVTVTREQLQAACARYQRFALQMLVPTDDARKLLSTLRSGGATIGLLSNAHDDIANAFADSELAPYFEAAVFSCRLGYRKPDERAFGAVTEALGGPTHEPITFVGDGSDDELSGAEAAGMNAVLLRTDLDNAYDRDRPEVLGWEGAAIDKLSDLPAVLGWPSADAGPDGTRRAGVDSE